MGISRDEAESMGLPFSLRRQVCDLSILLPPFCSVTLCSFHALSSPPPLLPLCFWFLQGTCSPPVTFRVKFPKSTLTAHALPRTCTSFYASADEVAEALCFQVVRPSVCVYLRPSMLIFCFLCNCLSDWHKIFIIGVNTHVKCFQDNYDIIGHVVWQPRWKTGNVGPLAN